MDAGDTETLLALVSSLLVGNPPDTETILEALVCCRGDVEATAELLNGSKVKSRKRKRPNLDDWFKSTSRPLEPPHSPTSKRRLTKDLTAVPKPVSISRKQAPVMNLVSVPRPPLPSRKTPQLRPLMLSHPDMVAKHTPCTLHLSVLPPELACRLFYTLLRDARGWERNKWWLFDRMVESPHRTSFFVRKDDGLDGNEAWQEAAQYWYNGRVTGTPNVFPPSMEEACKIIEDVVNEQMKLRARFPLEWNADGGDPTWRANVAASNCYEGTKESVGFHSDQMTYLGPYPTIASLSLGTQRTFSLREMIPTSEANQRKARTFNMPLPHNSLTIMHASCQERFKHCVPPQPAIDLYRPAFPETPGAKTEPSNCRFNVTFRFYRPDFRPPSTPRCDCGIPTVLRADMKNRSDGLNDRYWWTCYAGAQNEGKGCNYWKLLDMKAEGRGPYMAK